MVLTLNYYQVKRNKNLKGGDSNTMLTIKNKTAALVTSFAMMAYTVMPVFAAVEGQATNDTTGANSDNVSTISVQQSSTLVQNNNANIDNKVQLQLNTGNNTANKNTGDGSVKTGSVAFGTALSNKVNSNVASLDACGGCDMDIQTSNTKTGADSWNETEVELVKTNDVFQTNKADVDNTVKADVNTGGNKANKNTTSGSVLTGDVEGTVLVDNVLNRNLASMRGGNGGSTLDASNDTTGADSDNESSIDVIFANLVSQSNWADVDNDVDLDINTGNNTANKNTGIGEVVTGNADLGVALDTLANENFLDFSGCCDVMFDTLNTKTGADSWNESEVEVVNATQAYQSNCGYDNQILGFDFEGRRGNDCEIENFVGGQLNTGENHTNKNTNDDVVTGEVDAIVTVESDTNHNALGDLTMPEWDVEFPGDMSGWGWMMWMFGNN